MPATGDVRPLRNTYTGYSISCAAVWAMILALARRRLDPPAWRVLRLACVGWWSGWTSATIARVSYPPPKKLEPDAQGRLAVVSVVLVAVGLLSVIRLLAGGKRAMSATASTLPD